MSQWPASGDDELLAGMRAGDEDAFRVFVSRYHQSMVRPARPHVASRAVAEEVAQEIWRRHIPGLRRPGRQPGRRPRRQARSAHRRGHT